MFHQSNGSTLNSFVRHMEYKFDASSRPDLYLMCDLGTQCLIHSARHAMQTVLCP